MWMDGAFMGAHFLSFLVLGLTKVVKFKLTLFFPFLNLGWFYFQGFFFLQPPMFAQVSPTYLPLNYYLCILASSFPHLSTYVPTYPSIYLPTHPSTYVPMYLCTKSPPSQWWWMYYNIPCRLLHSPSYLPPY
jgi:hypothetical protein